MSHEWPTAPVSITEAARLISAAGHPVDRSNLSRFIESRGFPVTERGRAKLVDAKALHHAYASDYTRQLMDPRPKAPPAPAQAPAPSFDPKRRETEAKAARQEIELARQLGLLVPVEELDAVCAAAIAEHHAASSALVRDEASALLADLHLPATHAGAVRARLKRAYRAMRLKLAQAFAEGLALPAETPAETHARLMKLALHARRLRGL